MAAANAPILMREALTVSSLSFTLFSSFFSLLVYYYYYFSTQLNSDNTNHILIGYDFSIRVLEYYSVVIFTIVLYFVVVEFAQI